MKKRVNTDHDFEDTSPSEEGVLPAVLPESQDWRRLAALSADWYWEQGADLRFNRFESIAGGPGLGGLEQSLMGKTWSDMVNAVDGEVLLRATSARQIEQAQRAHAVFHDVEIQCPSRDDSPCWLQVSGTPVHDVQGVFRGYCGVGRNISRRKNAERHEVARLAFYDDLTGLPNRRMLRDHLARVLEERRSNRGYVLLLLLDLDDFKSLNNVLGREWGDKLLAQVGQRLLKCCSGKADLVARLGSDEFAVLFASSGQDVSRAQDMARTLLASMGSELSHAYVVNGNEIHNPPTVCALLFNSPEVSADELLKQVDMTLYQAKKVDSGQPLVAVMDGQTQTALQTRTALEADIRQGIARGEILLHYQPIVNAHREMVGVEALVRWRHPVFGLVQPMQFIPLAEQAGLILQMGKMILQMACGQLAFWARSSKTSHLDVSVNVSVREFRSAAFVPQVQEILAETGARVDRLKFELTESLLLTGVEDVTQKMEQLRAMGVSFVLDDFGTGYSSLAYLKRLPLSQLKIDKAFVHDICVDENDAEIARTIILLAHNLGMEVVAEGVETAEQFHFLRDNGCDKFQGFLFGHSMPPQQLQMDGPLDFLDFQDTSPDPL